jgi:O-acetyl-ADP-ribose deacetylase (regulator of RNase III)
MIRAVFGGAQVTLVLGDITVQAVDAIVNAANSDLLGGGGVDGAIHRAGGPGFDAACREAARLHAPLPPGEAVAVSGGRLAAKRVILTVGPVWHGGGAEEARILANAYRSSLSLAREEGLRTIAFPSISTGAYGYPLAEAAAIALTTIKAELEARPGSFDEVRVVLFGEATLEAYKAALGALGALSHRWSRS